MCKAGGGDDFACYEAITTEEHARARSQDVGPEPAGILSEFLFDRSVLAPPALAPAPGGGRLLPQ